MSPSRFVGQSLPLRLLPWLLILVGLWQFWNTYTFLTNRRIFEAAPSAFIA